MPQRYDPIHDILVDTDDKPTEQPTEPSKEPEAEPPTEPPTVPSTEVVTTTASTEEPDVKRDESASTEPLPEQEPESTETAQPPSETPDQEAQSVDTPNEKKHKLSPSPSKIPLKKIKNKGGKSATVLSSARSRHLKKDDGKPFLRKDIQYQFLKDLFEDETRAFRDPYADSTDKVLTEPEGPHKLTFSEIYIKTIAHSSKCSKILRDRLLNDMKMSIPTSMICLLVNVGRMNTTINFVPDMKSQLRTYHSIPCLQVDYDASENKFTNNGNGGDKQLQDTPRLKSILKACCDDTDEPNALNLLENVKTLPRTSVINVIFLLCNAEENINRKYLVNVGYSFFDIFMNSDYSPKTRAKLFLWLVYTYLETNLGDDEIAQNPYGGFIPPVLEKTNVDHDIETPEEIEFGENLYGQRVKFLAEDDSEIRKEEKAEKAKKTTDTPSKPTTKQEKPTPVPKSSATPASKQAPTKSQSTSSEPQFTFPVLPKSDIDTDKVRKSLKYLGRIFNKKRDKMGQVKYEHSKIIQSEKADNEPEENPAPVAANRMRLKNYKGDYVENSDKFYKLFNLLKNDFVEMAKADEQKEVEIELPYEDATKDLTLKSFSVNI